MMNIEDLETIIKARLSDASSEKSYTKFLAEGGLKRCAKKLGEECVEAALAAALGDREELVKEAADVIYHLLVTLHVAGKSWADVSEELERRTTQSGIEEKASRK
jgi:phosphoribosyl-ATP pyrophosphohydrolase